MHAAERARVLAEVLEAHALAHARSHEPAGQHSAVGRAVALEPLLEGLGTRARRLVQHVVQALEIARIAVRLELAHDGGDATREPLEHHGVGHLEEEVEPLGRLLGLARGHPLDLARELGAVRRLHREQGREPAELLRDGLGDEGGGEGRDRGSWGDAHLRDGLGDLGLHRGADHRELHPGKPLLGHQPGLGVLVGANLAADEQAAGEKP